MSKSDAAPAKGALKGVPRTASKQGRKAAAVHAESAPKSSARDVGAAKPRATAVSTRRTQAERSEATKRKVLEAAIQLLRRRGFGGLRTSEVADLAGVSRGAQLHHFPTKRDLILAALCYLNETTATQSKLRAKQAEAAENPIAGVIADAHDFFFSDFFFVELAVTMGDEEAQELRRDAYKMSRASRFAVEAAWLETMVAAGIPRQLAADVLALTLSIVRGFAVRTFIEDDRERFFHLYKVWRDIVGTYLATHMDQPVSEDVPDKDKELPRGQDRSPPVVSRPAGRRRAGGHRQIRE